MQPARAKKDSTVHAFEMDAERYAALLKVAALLPEKSFVLNNVAITSGAAGSEVKISKSDEGLTLGVGSAHSAVRSTTIDAYLQ